MDGWYYYYLSICDSVNEGCAEYLLSAGWLIVYGNWLMVKVDGSTEDADSTALN